MNLGLSGFKENPTSTVAGILAGIGMIAITLGWTDEGTWAKWSGLAVSIIVTILGVLYKGKPVE